jgi:hypothetical protein
LNFIGDPQYCNLSVIFIRAVSLSFSPRTSAKVTPCISTSGLYMHTRVPPTFDDLYELSESTVDRRAQRLDVFIEVHGRDSTFSHTFGCELEFLQSRFSFIFPGFLDHKNSPHRPSYTVH